MNRTSAVTNLANQALCETIWVLADYSVNKSNEWKYCWTCGLISFTYCARPVRVKDGVPSPA